MKLTIIRGVPGSGKTTLAKKLISENTNNEHVICHYEADMYFTDENGKYKFVPKLIEDAHAWCGTSVEIALRKGWDVIVSNTFVQKWEMAAYLTLAETYGAEVEVLKCTGEYASVHDVPAATIAKMRDKWED